MACGAALRASLPAASSGPPAPYTPRHLVDEILRSRAAMEGSRRHVTVLFADVKDSLPLSAMLGAEAWHEVLERYFALLAETVHSHEGSINQYTGDGVMALFGAPIAHEDHARRACAAALDVIEHIDALAGFVSERHDLSFNVRIGLNSGEVVVGRIGDDLRMDYTAQGPVVAVAARMEALADSNSAFLTPTTARLVEGYFELERREPTRVKGLDEPMVVYMLRARGQQQSRIDVARVRGFSPLVNRVAEMRKLTDALEASRLRGGRAIVMVGEPGVGKSRLCLALADFARRLEFTVHSAACAPEGLQLRSSPMQALLRSYFRIEDGDDYGRANAKVSQLVRTLGERESAATAVLEVLGLEGRPQGPRLHPEARERLLHQVARKLAAGPTRALVIVDDLQWMDLQDTAFLGAFAEALPGGATLLIVNHRSDFESPLAELEHCEVLSLQSLEPEATMELVDALLGKDPGLAPVRDLLASSTSGNPFFIEESVRALSERQLLEGAPGSYQPAATIDSIVIPDSVQSVIAARIDRLCDEDQEVLKMASVVGSNCPTRLLRELGFDGEALEASLGRLRATEFLARTEDGAEESHTFTHGLLREVTYQMQLSAPRSERHWGIAEALLARSDEPGFSLAGLAAHHLERAGRTMGAAEQFLRAAREASDHSATFKYLQRARQLASEADGSGEAQRLELRAGILLLSMGWRHGLDRAQARRLFERCEALIEAQGLRSLQPGLHSSYGRLCSLHSTADYLSHVELAVDLAREHRPAHVLSLQIMLSHALRHAGRLREGLELGELLMQRLRSEPGMEVPGFDFDPALWLQALAGHSLLWLGRIDEAYSNLREVLQRARELEQDEMAVMAVSLLADVAFFVGPIEDLPELALFACELAESRGNGHAVISAVEALGVTELVGGDPARAERTLSRAFELSERQGGVEFGERILTTRAEALLQLGDAAGAYELARFARDRAADRAATLYRARAACMVVRAVASGLNDASHHREAMESLKVGRAICAETGAALLLPYYQMEHARLAEALGQPSPTDAQDAIEWFSRMGGDAFGRGWSLA